MTFNESVFWPAFAAAGFLVEAVVWRVGQDAALPAVNVELAMPDEKLVTGTQSTQYVMQYQAADLPDLAEGDAVTIGAQAFKVREPPFTDGADPTGYFRKAMLTLVDP